MTIPEQDPSGISPHTPGAKLDDGKLRPDLVLGEFARALEAVSAVGTFGANKYTDNGWLFVPDGIRRYDNAFWRHYLKRKIGEKVDPQSQLLHRAHEAWNALAALELVLRNEENGFQQGGLSQCVPISNSASRMQ